MAGEIFDKLTRLARNRVTVEGLGVNDYLADSEAQLDVEKRNAKARQYEQAVNQKIEKDIAQRSKDREMFGTDDPKRVAAIKALGGFDQGAIAADMAIDPQGTRDRFDRMVAIAGHGGIQDAPEGPPTTDRTYYRVNPKTGTLEFTNRPDVAAQEGYRRYNSDSGLHKDLGAPGGDVGRIGAGTGPEGTVTEKPLEDVLFEGKLEQARSVVEKPEQKVKEAVAQEKYFDEVWNNTDNIHDAREKIKNDLVNGLVGERKDLTLQGLRAVDAAIAKRGRTPMEMAKPGIDKTMFKPWKKPGKGGMGADLAEPASVLNPGGGTNETTKVQQKNLMATSDASAQLMDSLPKEQPTAYQYAKGTVTPRPRETAAPSPQRPGQQLAQLGGGRPSFVLPQDEIVPERPAPELRNAPYNPGNAGEDDEGASAAEAVLRSLFATKPGKRRRLDLDRAMSGF